MTASLQAPPTTATMPVAPTPTTRSEPTASLPSGSRPTPPSITCDRYWPEATGRRCRHYRSEGVCTEQAERLEECSEWRKVNPTQPTPASVMLVPEAPAGAAGLPLFDQDAGRETPVVHSPRSLAEAAAPPPSLPLPAGLTAEDIASFKALGAEVCLTSDAGEMWLVPAYRDPSRLEISVDHAATLVCVVHAFPGARVRTVRVWAGSEAA